MNHLVMIMLILKSDTPPNSAVTLLRCEEGGCEHGVVAHRKILDGIQE